MVAKLKVDDQSLGSQADQFVYIYAHLEGAAQQTCLAYFQHTAWTKEATPDHFIAYLDRSYKDPNRKMRATNQLRTMKQGEASFASFLPRFERALADAGASDWADEAKVAFLEGTLNQKMIRVMVTERLPKTYGEYVARILEIDGKLQSLLGKLSYFPDWNARPRGSQPRAGPEDERPRTQNRTSPERMDWEPTQPVKIGAATSDRGDLTPVQRSRCLREGRCFICREPGHRALNCEKRSRKTKKTSVVRTELKERIESSDEEIVETLSDEEALN